MEKSPIVRHEAPRLRKYADLRNAIVHDRNYPHEIIAEPTETALARFSELVNRIVAPKRLESFQKQLRVFLPEERLIDALSYMRTNDFSQVIVQNAGNISLLTVEGITKWLGKQAAQELVAQELVLVTEATIKDAIAHDLQGNFKVMSRRNTVDDALAAFAESIEQGHPRLYAIIVNQNGNRSEKPLGLITPWDLIEYSRG